MDASTTRDVHTANPIDTIGEEEINLAEMLKELMYQNINISQNLKLLCNKMVT